MVFNIETYLNSLPEDIEEIDVSHKKLKYIPDLSKFKNLKMLNCSGNQLTSLPSLNENLEVLQCSNNCLNSLPSLNKKLKVLYCSKNCLSSLPSLNENLKILDCSNNCLNYLPRLNEKLEVLQCSNNCLNSLPSLNEKLEGLYCYVNKLYSLPYLNEKLISFNFDNNPICEIINSRKNMNETKEKIKIFNKFRYLYYCLKFKKQFRDLLWKKVREPKIMRRYHPSYLIENLDVDIDLEMVVNSW
jgi:hypothetical protein